MSREHIELGLFRPDPKPSAPPVNPDDSAGRGRGVEPRPVAEPGTHSSRETTRPAETPTFAEPRTTVKARRASDVDDDSQSSARVAAPAVMEQRAGAPSGPRVEALLDRRTAPRAVDEPGAMTARAASSVPVTPKPDVAGVPAAPAAATRWRGVGCRADVRRAACIHIGPRRIGSCAYACICCARLTGCCRAARRRRGRIPRVRSWRPWRSRRRPERADTARGCRPDVPRDVAAARARPAGNHGRRAHRQ